MMNGPRPLGLLISGLLLATLVMGCSNERDGSDTQAACQAYAEAANACWQVASGADILEASVCGQIDSDRNTSQVDDGSDCEVRDLEAVYTCYAEKFAEQIVSEEPYCSAEG